MVNGISSNLLQSYIESSHNAGSAQNDDFLSKIGVVSTTDRYKAYFHDYLAEAIKSRMNGVSREDLVSHLQSLIANDSEEGENSEEIAIMTNLIAEFDNLSRGENLITPQTLAAATELVA